MGRIPVVTGSGRARKSVAPLLALVLLLVFASGAAAETKRAQITVHGTPPAQVGIGTPPLKYYQGPVQHHVKVFVIFWGPGYASNPGGVVSAENTLFSTLRGSTYNEILDQYYDSTGHITDDVALGGTWVDGTGPSGTVNQSSASAEVARAINARGWPTGANIQYFVLPQPGSWIVLVNTTWCAAHYWDGSHAYAIIPYMGNVGTNFPSTCRADFGGTGSNSLADAMTSLSSHEYAEQVTDPNGSTGWLDQTGKSEIGDLCEPTSGPFGSVTAQDLWSNLANRCVAPGAPGGSSGNLLSNAGFELGSFSGWHRFSPSGGVTNVAVYNTSGGAREGTWFLASNTSASSGGSIYQDVPVATSPGQTYSFSIWARVPPGQTPPYSIKLALFGIGGTKQEVDTNTTSIGANWQLVTVSLSPTVAHTSLRAQIYLQTAATTINLDGATFASANQAEG